MSVSPVIRQRTFEIPPTVEHTDDGDEPCAFVKKSLRGGQADAARAADNQTTFVV